MRVCCMLKLCTVAVCFWFSQCGSGMFIADSESWFLSIPDPTTAPKEEGEKYFFCPIFCSHKYHKMEIWFYFLTGKENFFRQNITNYSTFYLKICHWAIKNMGLGSEIRDREKNYSGSRIHDKKGTASRIRIRNTGHNDRILNMFQQYHMYLKLIISVSRNEGVVEFSCYEDVLNVINKLDGTELNGRKIHIIDESKGSRRGRSRSRSRSRSRTRSRSRSRSKRSRTRSRSRSRSRSGKRAKSGSRKRSPSRSDSD